MVFGGGPFGTVPFGSMPGAATVPGAAAPVLVLRVGGDDAIANYLRIFDYSIQKELNARDTFSCALLSGDGWRPLIGQEVVLTWNGVRMFAGTINEKNEQFLSEGESLRRLLTIECTDWNQILDRRTAVGSYVNTSAGDIVRDLITRYLAAEGITPGTIQDGLTQSEANWNHEHMASILDELSRGVGFFWFVDYEKRLHFLSRENAAAPFSINEVNSRVRDGHVKESRNDFRNIQILKGWREITDPHTVRLKGDGTTRTWPLQFAVLEEPTARKSDGSIQTFGISGIEEGKNLYWSGGAKDITQDSDDAVLLDGEYFDVTYIGTYDTMLRLTDPASVADRKLVEGGTGQYEAVDVDSSLFGGELAITAASALIKQNALDAQLEFTTEVDGLDIGQLVTADFPTLGLANAELLITSIELTQLNLTTRSYRVSATTGEVKNAFKEFWMKFAKTGQKVGVREGDTVMYPVQAEDEAAVTSALVVVDRATVTHAWDQVDTFWEYAEWS